MKPRIPTLRTQAPLWVRRATVKAQEAEQRCRVSGKLQATWDGQKLTFQWTKKESR